MRPVVELDGGNHVTTATYFFHRELIKIVTDVCYLKVRFIPRAIVHTGRRGYMLIISAFFKLIEGMMDEIINSLLA